ncbi:ABC transporter permease [Arthrobacter pigmenti]
MKSPVQTRPAGAATATPDERAARVAPGPTQFTLVKAHTKAHILEQLRIPVAVISNTIFPSLAFLFFVIPQEAVASNPTAALTALAQLAMFGVMSAFLFSYGVGVAEDRANPWTTYLRTLPVGPVPATVARAAAAMMFAFFALVPLFVLGGFLTSALDAFTGDGLSWWRVPASLAVFLLCGLPFLALGLTIGYLCTSKVAVAVTQVVFFPMAFAGGMMLPPMIFPEWLNTFSLMLPSRAARDLSVDVLTTTGLHSSTIPVIIAWTLILGTLAVWANRRDQGRRFR